MGVGAGHGVCLSNREGLGEDSKPTRRRGVGLKTRPEPKEGEGPESRSRQAGAWW